MTDWASEPSRPIISLTAPALAIRSPLTISDGVPVFSFGAVTEAVANKEAGIFRPPISSGCSSLFMCGLIPTADSTRSAPKMDPFTLAYLGHSDISITKRYVHPEDGTVRAAMERAASEQLIPPLLPHCINRRSRDIFGSWCNQLKERALLNRGERI